MFLPKIFTLLHKHFLKLLKFYAVELYPKIALFVIKLFQTQTIFKNYAHFKRKLNSMTMWGRKDKSFKETQKISTY